MEISVLGKTANLRTSREFTNSFPKCEKKPNQFLPNLQQTRILGHHIGAINYFENVENQSYVC